MAKPEELLEASRAREELYDTLSLLSDRLNYAKRFDEATERTEFRMKAYKERNPLGFALTVVGVAATVGVVTWAVTTKILRKL